MVGVSDGKVIHDQGKADVPSGVSPQYKFGKTSTFKRYLRVVRKPT